VESIIGILVKKSGIFVKQVDPAANIAEVSTEGTNQN
jgi:hypothetical protein